MYVTRTHLPRSVHEVVLCVGTERACVFVLVRCLCVYANRESVCVVWCGVCCLVCVCACVSELTIHSTLARGTSLL